MSNDAHAATLPPPQTVLALFELEQRATREYIHLADTLTQLAERLGFNAQQTKTETPLAMAAKWLALMIGRGTQQDTSQTQAQSPLISHRLRLYDLREFDPIFSFTAPPTREISELTPLLRHVAKMGALPDNGSADTGTGNLTTFEQIGFYREELESVLGVMLSPFSTTDSTEITNTSETIRGTQTQRHPERLAEFIRMLIDCNPAIDLHSDNGNYTGRQVRTRLERIITTGYTQRHSKIPSQNTISSYLTTL